jgi:hypothetical protein
MKQILSPSYLCLSDVELCERLIGWRWLSNLPPENEAIISSVHSFSHSNLMLKFCIVDFQWILNCLYLPFEKIEARV